MFYSEVEIGQKAKGRVGIMFTFLGAIKPHSIRRIKIVNMQSYFYLGFIVILLFSASNSHPEFINFITEAEPTNFLDGFSIQELEEQQNTDVQCAQSPEFCPAAIYRSYDGSCNNLKNPTWGASQTPYGRLLPPKYGDGISSAALAKSGNELPWPRSISLLLYPEVKIEDPKFTLAAMQFGQIIAHDMSLIAEPNTATQCCTQDGQPLQANQLPAGCFPILLPEGDPQRQVTNTKCLNFGRTLTTRDLNCPSASGATDQVTIITHFLDLSNVYGSNAQVNQMLREFNRGRLRVAQRNHREWPPQANNVSQSCPFARSTTEACYMAGDVRVNQNPQLAVLQIIFLREHNRLAQILSELNPHWDDETIFQEARKINIAMYQHITYYEWLPIFIGVTNSYNNKIIFESKGGFVNDYNPKVNPATLNEHATSTSRFYHSLIVGFLDLLSKQRQVLGNIRLSDWFNRPTVVESGDNFDQLTRGMITQPESKANQFVDKEVTQHLFRPPGQPFGRDLKAADVARNRDHGLSSYNDYRVLCGLPKAHSFDDFLDTIPKENVEKLTLLYEDPDDVDLTVGSSLEKIVPGTLAGPVNLCIFTEQFYRSRAGDRYFYENGSPNTGAGFTLDQLNEIRKVTMARLLCDNGHNLAKLQPFIFLRISFSNQLTSCDNIPSVNLLHWKEEKLGTSNADHFF
ncbi:hypothetical protein RN001_005399 [Aquatica leii]|uniref:Peroxidase n=1 Tax=Aquatica leii TaxID=1421715 RepID=A0AAN7Q6W6_9COLE|nr:hypothetical protein RN001_005399 [Aquatica leii]